MPLGSLASIALYFFITTAIHGFSTIVYFEVLIANTKRSQAIVIYDDCTNPVQQCECNFLSVQNFTLSSSSTNDWKGKNLLNHFPFLINKNQHFKTRLMNFVL